MFLVFPSTRHTLLQRAAGSAEERALALNAVAEIYWPPCCRYVMLRWRASYDQAQDLTQGFFAALLEQEILARYDSGRGTFRPYLRACLDQFVMKEFERNQAAKRGGGVTMAPLDSEAGLASGDPSPEEIFHREWQRQMFTLAASDLRQWCEATDRAVRFQILRDYDLAEDRRPSYEELGATYGLPVSTVTNHLAWARRELRRLLEERIGLVVSDGSKQRRELRSLLYGADR